MTRSTTDRTIYAHSAPGRPLTEWERLRDHAALVAAGATRAADAFGTGALAGVAGLLHDVGKCSQDFQDHILSPGGQGPNHSYAGAMVARERYPGMAGRTLAAIVAGHHAGLADGVDLEGRLGHDGPGIPVYDGWEPEVGPLPRPCDLPAPTMRNGPAKGFSASFLTRMLYSCLVDADSVATEAYYAGIEERTAARGGGTPLADLRTRLDDHLARLAAGSAGSDIDRLRGECLSHVRDRAGMPPGLFTLTVPTGGGKTLASLAFGLDHALAHGLRRVIHVAPYTSIVEQTADAFRGALASDEAGEKTVDVLEHHSGGDTDAGPAGVSRDGEGSGATPREALRRAVENWDTPVVVTTAVQFFESLFANTRTPCRKLHNVAGSVVVLDEVQTLPVHLLRPCLAAVAELASNYRCTVVLCTATQPALRVQDGLGGGLDIPDDRELAPAGLRSHPAFDRVRILRKGTTTDADIASRFAEVPSMLCIVNRRTHAQRLFEAIRHLPEACHLSTAMCPDHRRATLALARARLAASKPVRMVATSLVEAGVDIDLAEVWRAHAGLDAILQAAGRCNREGRMAAPGTVVVFDVPGDTPVRGQAEAWQATRAVMRRHEDLRSPGALRDYHADLLWQRGPAAFDSATLNGERYPVMDRIAERATSLAFPFASVARAFRVVEDVHTHVIVPWRGDARDRAFDGVMGRLSAGGSPSRGDMRRLRQRMVGIPGRLRDAWLKTGALVPVHPGLGDDLLRLADASLHDEATGVSLSPPGR